MVSLLLVLQYQFLLLFLISWEALRALAYTLLSSQFHANSERGGETSPSLLWLLMVSFCFNSYYLNFFVSQLVWWCAGCYFGFMKEPVYEMLVWWNFACLFCFRFIFGNEIWDRELLLFCYFCFFYFPLIYYLSCSSIALTLKFFFFYCHDMGNWIEYSVGRKRLLVFFYC